MASQFVFDGFSVCIWWLLCLNLLPSVFVFDGFSETYLLALVYVLVGFSDCICWLQ